MNVFLTNRCIVAIMVIIFFSACTERTTYEISGIAEGLEDGYTIELRNALTEKEIAKTEVKNGKFYFEGSVDQPYLVKVIFGGPYENMVLENAEYTIFIGEHFKYIDGGEINNKVFGYKIEADYQKIVKENALAPNPFEGLDPLDKEAREKATKVYKIMMNKERGYRHNYEKNILEGNYSTLIKLFTLSQNYDIKNYGVNKKLQLLNTYEKDLGLHPLLVSYRERFTRQKKTEDLRKSVSPGKPYKEVIAKTIEDQEIKLSEVIAKNKYTLLEMWASWCNPCRGEFPHLKKAYDHYHEKGFEIFALSLDENKEAWLKAMKEENVPWINAVDYKGFNGAGPKDYAVVGIPDSFLIDQNGKIVAAGRNVRGHKLDEKLEALLGE